jgi:hypothetical protein
VTVDRDRDRDRWLGRCAAISLAVVLSIPSRADAGDPKIVIFGGGWGPEGTQASIEAHVAALAKVLGPNQPTVLFAGDASARSVQVALQEEDETDRILGVVFDRRDHLQVGYRKKEVPSAKSSREALLAVLAANASEDGLIVLGAGHASGADAENQAALDLWGPGDKLSVGELARHLDRSPKGPVAFVLGQCHAGAFADVMYARGKAPRIAEPTRCVLAAVPHDRESAGCTPDVADPSAKAYMAMIAEAFEKRTDHDGDGAVSLAEAHAYARIHDRTVDVPVASSEIWLLSRLGGRAPRAEKVALAALLPKARPTERQVLEKLDGGRLLEAGPKAVVAELDELEHRIQEDAHRLDGLLDEREMIRRRLVDALLSKFPELVNPYHHVSRKMLANGAREVIELVTKHPEWRELTRRDEEIDARDRQLLSMEKRAALLTRFARTVQVVAAERLLSKRDAKAFARLLACESMKPKLRQP